MNAMPYFTFVLRVFLGGYFLFAAVPKIIEPLAFATSISHYQMMPSYLVNGFALVMPWLELLVGTAMVLGISIRTSSIVYALLVLMFTAAVAWAVVQGLKIDCGCFGDGASEEVGWLKVGKNLLLVGGCVVLWIWPDSVLKLGDLLGTRGKE